jgi:hypothetical protein
MPAMVIGMSSTTASSRSACRARSSSGSARGSPPAGSATATPRGTPGRRSAAAPLRAEAADLVQPGGRRAVDVVERAAVEGGRLFGVRGDVGAVFSGVCGLGGSSRWGAPGTGLRPGAWRRPLEGERRSRFAAWVQYSWLASAFQWYSDRAEATRWKSRGSWGWPAAFSSAASGVKSASVIGSICASAPSDFDAALHVDHRFVERIAERVAGVAAHHQPAGLRHEAREAAHRAADDDVGPLQRDAAAQPASPSITSSPP